MNTKSKETHKDKAQVLAEFEGFDTPESLLIDCAENEYPSVPAICTNEGCDYCDFVEPDCRNAECEDCGTKTVCSIHMLMGVI